MKNYLYTILIIALSYMLKKKHLLILLRKEIMQIKELIQKVENNKSIYVNEDAERIEKFSDRVSERNQAY